MYTRKDVSSISVLTRNNNGSYGTEEGQRYNGTAQRHNGMVETRHYITSLPFFNALQSDAGFNADASRTC